MPVAMVVVVVVAMPPMMVMMMTVSPVNFGRRQPGVFLNGCGSAGIAERQCVRRRGKREQRANGSETQNFRELHQISPRSCVTSAPNGSPQRCTQSAACDLNAP